MKKMLVLLGLAAAPILFAADTNTAANALEVAPVAPVSLLEQASLVREIAEDASRGFDAEAHAKWVREQIDALKDPANAPTVATTNSVLPAPLYFSTPNAPVVISALPQAGTSKRPASEELQQVIDRLRMLKHGLETTPKSQ